MKSIKNFFHFHWLTSKLCPTDNHMDIMENCIFEAITHFWENGGEEAIRSQYEILAHPSRTMAMDKENQVPYEISRDTYMRLHACYQWAKWRPTFWEAVDHTEDDDVVLAENFMARDEFFMTELVKLRFHLWR